MRERDVPWGVALLLVLALAGTHAVRAPRQHAEAHSGGSGLLRPSLWPQARFRGGEHGAVARAGGREASGAGLRAPPATAVRRSLLQEDHEDEDEGDFFPEETDTLCPSSLAPGRELLITETCTLASLPARLDYPGAAISGVLSTGTAASLPMMLLPDEGPRANVNVSVQPGAVLQLNRLLFRSDADEDPSTLAQLLVPRFVLLTPGAQVAMRDAGKMMELKPDRVEELFQEMLSEAAVVAALREWKYAIYSDRRSWLHINWYAADGVTARSVGIVNMVRHMGPALSSSSYALEVSNATIVDVFMKHATVATPEPFLMYLVENVTFWPRLDWPAKGLAIARPVYLVGWSFVATAVDFGNCAGCASLTGKWSNLTLDSLVLENLGYGDPRDPDAADVSVVSAIDFWFFNTTRNEPRLSLLNCTVVVPLEREVDTMRYWSGVFNSDLAAQSAWLRDGLNLTVWEVRVDSPNSLTFSKYVSPRAFMRDAVLQSRPVVFPRRPIPNWNVSKVEDFFKPHMPPPGVVICNTAKEVMAALRHVLHPMVCLMTREVVDLAPDPAVGWPPPGGQLVVGDTFFFLRGYLPPHAASNNSGPGARRLLAQVALPDLSVAAAQHYAHGEAQLHHDDADLAEVHLGYASSLFTVQHNTGKDSGIIELQRLRLVQLPQGPSARKATSLDDPAPWTLMLWSFYRTSMGLNLTDVELVLPRPEFEEVKRLRGEASSFAIYLQGAVISFSETYYLNSARTHLMAHFLEGHLMSGHGVTLTSGDDHDVAPAPDYAWPAAASRAGATAPGGGGGLAPPGQKALIATLTVVAAAAAGVLALLVMSSRRRRRQQRAQQAAAAAALGGPGSKGDGSACMAPDSHSHPPSGTGRIGSGSSSGTCAACAVAHSVMLDTPSGSAAGRWQQLLLAINARVSDIHAKRLAAGFSLGQPGDPNGTPGASDPLPGLASRSATVAAALHQRPRSATGAVLWDLGDAASPAQLVAAGAAVGGGSYTVGRSGSSFRSGGSATQSMPRHGQPQQLQILEALGSGTFGSVFRARWHGSEVAVKLVQLPATLVGASCEGAAGDVERAAAFASARERMAIQEAAISTTMTHPSIVALYCVGLRPVHAGSSLAEEEPEPALGEGQEPAPRVNSLVVGAEVGSGDGSVVVAWELQLIMEYCDLGTLRQALSAGRLRDPVTGLTRLGLVLGLAHQVASAMQYLHEESILHGDLKPSNVLLKSQPGAGAPPPLPGAPVDAEAAGVSARVSDFGLSWSMDAAATHVSSCHAGTMTHMSPELLLDGKASKASDAYAFGILLWELSTGGVAFAGVPKPLLGHAIVTQRLRPVWPPPAVGPVWARLKALTEHCWAHNAAVRPAFAEAVAELEDLQGLLRADPAACQLPAAAAAASAAAAAGGQEWWEQACWKGLQTPDGCESLDLGGTESRLAVMKAQQAAMAAPRSGSSSGGGGLYAGAPLRQPQQPWPAPPQADLCRQPLPPAALKQQQQTRQQQQQQQQQQPPPPPPSPPPPPPQQQQQQPQQHPPALSEPPQQPQQLLQPWTVPASSPLATPGLLPPHGALPGQHHQQVPAGVPRGLRLGAAAPDSLPDASANEDDSSACDSASFAAGVH